MSSPSPLWSKAASLSKPSAISRRLTAKPFVRRWIGIDHAFPTPPQRSQHGAHRQGMLLGEGREKMKTKERIVETATSLFNEQGTQAISTNHIAQALSM